MYFVKTPWWLKKMYPSFTWDISTEEKNIYLTFDDGPHETATPFVLDALKQYNAKATFFCIGKNVVNNPAIYARIIDEGHTVGNHSQNHLNGWKTNDKEYVQDVFEAAKYIDSKLFRPPYGRISRFQAGILSGRKGNAQDPNFKIIMWTVLSGDFDADLSPEKCLDNVLLNSSSGAIIVFHDSTKAFERMSFALPKTLQYFSEKGFQFKAMQ